MEKHMIKGGCRKCFYVFCKCCDSRGNQNRGVCNESDY